MSISVEKLYKVFQDPQQPEVAAVDRIEFQVRAGEIFGLLGPNGAGKTTTLRMLATLLRPTSGSASIAGHDLWKNPSHVRRSIGYLSADSGVYDRLTPREIVEHFGQLYGLSRSQVRDRTEELFEHFSMGAHSDRLCMHLSSGIRQKVSIIRSLVHSPPVLLLDEPTRSLDILVARTVTDFIRQARQRGSCILLSTHDMNEASSLCDSFAILHRGRILAQGATHELETRFGGKSLEQLFFHTIEHDRGVPRVSK
ncbi:MAG: ATP-binding cassette domain-containing protein [Planctomycetota bacterium]|nr:ATP-binding cassette domain-containing protein [Planctomycetota bacterium]